MWYEFSEQLSDFLGSISLGDIIKEQVVVKTQFKLDETTQQIATMFPVSSNIKVAWLFNKLFSYDLLDHYFNLKIRFCS